MYTVKFEVIIENGIVRIPQKYQDLQERREVRFLIMYDNNKYKTNIEKRKKDECDFYRHNRLSI